MGKKVEQIKQNYRSKWKNSYYTSVQALTKQSGNKQSSISEQVVYQSIQNKKWEEGGSERREQLKAQIT